MEFDFFRAQMENRFDKTYTDEQAEFFKDFTRPLLAFADPGTGKTESVVTGLICAEMVHRISPTNIYALSFTREATIELMNRHERACKKLGISSYVHFKTFDSLCTEIIRENFSLLSTPYWEVNEITISESIAVEDLAEFISDVAQEREISLNPNNIKSIVFAIRSLNASLIFDRAHVESKLAFKRCNMEFEDFEKIRKEVYLNNKILKKIPVDDISLYTLEILHKSPKLVEQLKAKHRIMVVDEFQDMSLIKLDLLSKFTDNLIVVGDMKQQIYAFNGACSEIVEMFRKYYPERREVELTQSFRCAKPIAEYATKLILPNKMGGDHFTGKDIEAKVEFHNQYDIDGLCRKIKDELVENGHKFPKQIMFLYRNNYSSIPVVEKLYEYRVPMLMSKYIEAHKLPIIRDLCGLIEICRNPMSPHVLEILNKLVPEFNKFIDKPMKNPLVQIMKGNGLGFFDIDYQFKDTRCQQLLYSCLKEAKEAINKQAMTNVIFNELFPFYSAYYLRDKERYMEQPAKYYIQLVAGIVQKKTYTKFVTDELKKKEFADECAKNRFGIRCLTLHGAKGTEADIVHILDADEGIIPNMRKLEETLKHGCIIDAARDLRNERSLVYVATTRAKEELHIHYRSELSSLFTSSNNFEHLDLAYQNYSPFHNDVEVFAEMFS